MECCTSRKGRLSDNEGLNWPTIFANPFIGDKPGERMGLARRNSGAKFLLPRSAESTSDEKRGGSEKENRRESVKSSTITKTASLEVQDKASKKSKSPPPLQKAASLKESKEEGKGSKSPGNMSNPTSPKVVQSWDAQRKQMLQLEARKQSKLIKELMKDVPKEVCGAYYNSSVRIFFCVAFFCAHIVISYPVSFALKP